ncbi:MAG: hypothetical protein PUC06_00985 [Oscillospiraceae bacterium]|nr:hypothetical protein [Oscillospiraceae bacterium]
MKKNSMKLLSLLMMLALVLGMLAGCGNSAPTADADSASAPASAVEEAEDPADEAVEAEEPEEADAAEEEASAEEATPVEEEPAGPVPVELPIVEEPVHYSCWMPVAPYVGAMMDLEAFSENIVMVKAISEATNVYIDFNAVAGGFVEQEAFNLMIAGGDYMDILGVMNYYTTGHEGAIEDEVIIDIYDDLKEKCPNYWNLLTSDDNAYMEMRTESGYMGCIAQLLKKAGTENQGMIIRKDWLKAAGMDTPETMDDMEKYLQFCKDNYGAYAYLQYEGKDTDWGAAFNITPAGFNVMDGEVVSCYTMDNMKDYLTTMNDWYQKGLFNADFYNDTDITTVRTDMANDLCSFVDGSAEGMSNIFDMNPENTAMELCAIPYPKAEGTDEVHVGFISKLIKNSDTWSISTQCEQDLDPLFGLINYLYSEEGQLVYNWGIEGEAFEFDENGEPQWTDLVVNNPDGLNFMFASYLYATGVGSVYYPGVYDMEKGFYSYNDDQLEAVDILANLTDGAYSMPTYASLTVEEQTEYNGYATDLETYADAELLKFIMGDRSLDEYDDFVDTLFEMGLQEMIDLNQGAYDRAQEALNA